MKQAFLVALLLLLHLLLLKPAAAGIKTRIPAKHIPAAATVLAGREAACLPGASRESHRIGHIFRRLEAQAFRLFDRGPHRSPKLSPGVQTLLILLMIAGGILIGLGVLSVLLFVFASTFPFYAVGFLVFAWAAILAGEFFGIRAIVRNGKNYKPRVRRK